MNTYTFLSGREVAYSIALFLIIQPAIFQAQERVLGSNYENYLRLAQQDTLSAEVRSAYLRRAFTTIKMLPADTVKYYQISKLVELSSDIKDSLLFSVLAPRGHELAGELKDPALIADSHWNYGSYFLRCHRYDSSYYHYNRAYTHYIAAGRSYYAGKMLYNMAYIASETHDLTGAEILLFRGIEIFERTSKPLQQYRCYNILGNNADDLGEFEKSLIYYRKAASLIPLLENSKYYRLENYNNLGVRFYKMGLFEEGARIFGKALGEMEMVSGNEALYSKLLDNRAYCLVALGNLKDVFGPMQRAMAIRDSIGDGAGKVISRLRFAEYYGKIGDSAQGIAYAQKALALAKEHFLLRHQLDALEILASLDRPGAEIYLRRHIDLSASLNDRDRRLRNKFTAIQFETDKYIQENERLFRQQLWMGVGAFALILILLLIYRNSKQRAQNRELIFEREQQQYNEDLFLLRFKEKLNLEKGRTEERERISQELHDNIVSRLFALRFRWSELEASGKDRGHIHRQFLGLLENIEMDIRNLSYDLRHLISFKEDEFLKLLEGIIEDKREVGGFGSHFECTNPRDWEQLSHLAKIHLQRIFEEVLQNIVKHANASEVRVFMGREQEFLELSIADNGKGMHLSKIRKGLGMKSLDSRTKKLHGKVAIYSRPGNGTHIKLHIPFKLNIP